MSAYTAVALKSSPVGLTETCPTLLWLGVSVCVCVCEKSVRVIALQSVVSLLSFWASDKTQSHSNNMPSLYPFLFLPISVFPPLSHLSFISPSSLFLHSPSSNEPSLPSLFSPLPLSIIFNSWQLLEISPQTCDNCNTEETVYSTFKWVYLHRSVCAYVSIALLFICKFYFPLYGTGRDSYSYGVCYCVAYVSLC